MATRKSDKPIPTKLFSLVSSFFQGDQKKTKLWFKTPNPNLGVSPQWMINNQRVSKLQKYITNRYFENYENCSVKERKQQSIYLKTKTHKTADEYISALEWTNHSLRCRMAAMEITHWPRIRDLPKNERIPFRKFLTGQTVPLIKDVAYKDQDAYYESDYQQWKAIQACQKQHPFSWD